jgi:hypothetical protein
MEIDRLRDSIYKSVGKTGRLQYSLHYKSLT